jgi:hypothetical protein
MGEVYKAHDSRLGRDVAIKVLPAGFANAPERLARFEQEARAAATVNHPCILAVYDIGQHDGAPYIVSELLEGETLREVLNGGVLPVRTGVEYAVQIARGLAAAHEKGVTHRDLKPENIFVTRDWRVKILDFGLAKLTKADSGVVDMTAQASQPETIPGVVLGSVGYMAPEQVRGLAGDHRADIFSFGAILYEMLLGRRAFRGESPADTLAAILDKDPPDLAIQHSLPAPLARILRRCLEKNPAARFKSADDLGFALEALSDADVTEPVGADSARSRASRSHGRRAWALPLMGVGLTAAMAGLFAGQYFDATPTESRPIQFTVAAPEGTRFLTAGAEPWHAVSPDGRQLAFVADSENRRSLWIRPLDRNDGRALPGTGDAAHPIWSPDSRAVAFFVGDELRKVDISGGPAQSLGRLGVADTSAAAYPWHRGGDWNREGVILVGSDQGIQRLDASSNRFTAVTRLDPSRQETSHRFPRFLPDGRHFLYLVRSALDEHQGVYLGSLDSDTRKRILPDDSNVAYAPPGYLFFVRGNTLVAQLFDERRMELAGDPIPVADPMPVPTTVRHFPFSVVEGVLTYRTTVMPDTRLVWFDRRGVETSSVPFAGRCFDPSLSPNGEHLALSCRDSRAESPNEVDIWVVDLTRQVPFRLTSNKASWVPVWSADGRRVIYGSSARTGNVDLYEKAWPGGSDEKGVLKGGVLKYPFSVSSGSVLYVEKGDIWALPLGGNGQPTAVTSSPFFENQPRLSPDERWLAYTSNESGTVQIWVRAYPSGSRWQVTTEGGRDPRWRGDGKELYYIAHDQKLMAVTVNGSSATFKSSSPELLFQTRAAESRAAYAVNGAGTRFLVNTVIEDAPVVLTVVANWSTGLGRPMP